MYPPQPGAPGPYGAPQQYAPTPQPAQPVDRELQGVLTSAEQRQSGWVRFHISEPNRQYPTKVDTKKPETIQQAMSLMGQPVVVQIREQESTQINPHNGRPYVNRYLNGIAPAGFSPGVLPQPGAVGPQGQVYQPQPPMQPQPGAFPQPQQPQWTQPQPAQQPVQQPQPVPMAISGYDRDINIMRQTAAKVVAMSVMALPPEQRTPIGMIEACEVFMAYFVHGPLRFGVTPFNQPRQPHNVPPQHDTVGNPPPYGGQQPVEATPQGVQTDIFGAPMDAAGNPVYSTDPGPQQGQVESLGQ
jgi:hypothetical protein